jgi:hypothetical protein
MIPAHWRLPLLSPFPTHAQTQVLTAIFAPETEARMAFESWQRSLDLNGPFDSEVFRLLPLLYLRLRELGIENNMMPRIKGVYRHALVRNIWLLHETGPPVTALERAGIPTLMLKGAPLAFLSYSRPGARPMADLDVAVPKERLAEAVHVLESAGWKSPRLDRGAVAIFHAAPFRNAHGSEFDLHWRILHETSGKAIEARFWETALPFDLDGIPTLMLDPALALVHTLIHGLRSNPVSPVRWVADALTLIRRSEGLDWDLLIAFSRAAQLTQRVRLGLTLLVRRFDALVPQDTQQKLALCRPSLMERAETVSVLFETRGLAGNAIAKPLNLLIDYMRQADESGLRRVPEFLDYVRRRLGMNSALELG